MSNGNILDAIASGLDAIVAESGLAVYVYKKPRTVNEAPMSIIYQDGGHLKLKISPPFCGNEDELACAFTRIIGYKPCSKQAEEENLVYYWDKQQPEDPNLAIIMEEISSRLV